MTNGDYLPRVQQGTEELMETIVRVLVFIPFLSVALVVPTAGFATDFSAKLNAVTLLCVSATGTLGAYLLARSHTLIQKRITKYVV